MVPGRIGTEHHPPEVAGLILARSKKPRENHRTSIAVDDDGVRRAELIVPVDSIELDSKAIPTIASLRRWLPRQDRFRDRPLPAAVDSVSIVLDDFVCTLFIGAMGGEFTGTHDGAEFIDAARTGAVDVYVVDGIDVRRSRPDDIDTAAAAGHLLGASVSAFVVQTL